MEIRTCRQAWRITQRENGGFDLSILENLSRFDNCGRHSNFNAISKQ